MRLCLFLTPVLANPCAKEREAKEIAWSEGVFERIFASQQAYIDCRSEDNKRQTTIAPRTSRTTSQHVTSVKPSTMPDIHEVRTEEQVSSFLRGGLEFLEQLQHENHEEASTHRNTKRTRDEPIQETWDDRWLIIIPIIIVSMILISMFSCSCSSKASATAPSAVIYNNERSRVHTAGSCATRHDMQGRKGVDSYRQTQGISINKVAGDLRAM